MERATDTKTRNREAVQIALNGGNPLKFLEEHGCTNPSGLWYTIKQKVKEESPDLYAKLPKRIQRKDAVKKEEPEVSIADALAGMQEATDTFFGECEKIGLNVNNAVKGPVTPDELYDAFKEPEEPKICQPVVYDDMTIREVEGLFGRYRRSDVGDATYIDLEFTDCCDVISNTVGQWRSFIAELDKAAKILGVEL